MCSRTMTAARCSSAGLEKTHETHERTRRHQRTGDDGFRGADAPHLAAPHPPAVEPRLPPDGRLVSPAPAVRIDDDGRPVVPRETDPEFVEAARWLGKAVDFIVIPCNAAHVGVHAIREADG